VWNGGFGGWWDGARLTAEDRRQLQNEARQLGRDVGDLRGMLDGINIDPRELGEVLQALRRLEDERTYQDVAELARLQSVIAEGLKRFEFTLRREVQSDANAAALSGVDESPAEYQRLNEEYFRSLGKVER
jgi:hypothetical protein